MEKTYTPPTIETRLYEWWEKAGYFAPRGNGPAYCIMLPPPNVTGSLHMGHAFQHTLMDILIRYHRMKGDKTLWQCGTDHAGIATQMVVERQLEQKGMSRHDLGREQFIEMVWDWKQHSGNTISQQLRRLGTSMDWSRERFTMDEGLSHAVRKVFIDLYREGVIYRGKRLVNWDPVLHTAISDLEVISREENGHMWHLRYPLEDGAGSLIVATTRPETMLGDTAVAVHPEDERYQSLIGRQVRLPLANRTIPVIADEYVDAEFGTGCVKITPAHDFNDYAVGLRHQLPLINIFTDDAALNEAVPEAYQGLDRYAARKQIVADLESAGFIEKTEVHKLMVPRGDRSGAVIEPYLTDQWYVKVKSLAEPAIEAVQSGAIRFVPQNWSRTYYDWMHNIEDWCISRQLWWGHQIPAWYDDEGNIFVGESEEEIRQSEGLSRDTTLVQDPDVLDTWFSSSLWPFSTLGWPEHTSAFREFYPTNVLVTGFDIIFFWVARMIMMGLKFTNEVPFREVYVHGLVRDSEGQKMSKSKGNILDPIDLIDGIDLESLINKRTSGLMRPDDAEKIERATRKQFPNGIEAYGTDSLRFTFASLATQGRDIRFDIGRIQGYRNFCNKLWNATRYVMMSVEAQSSDINHHEEDIGLADRWIQSRLSRSIKEVTLAIEGYRFDLASQALYEFTWDEYCDWYLELSKVTLNSQYVSESARRGTVRTLLTVLESLLRLMHPFIPFITEELWQKVSPLLKIPSDTIMLADYPQADDFKHDPDCEAAIDWIKAFILGVRRIRAERDIPPGKPLTVRIKGGTHEEHEWLKQHIHYIRALARLDSVADMGNTEMDIEDAVIALAGDMTLFVPLADLIDPAVEIERLNKEIARRTSEKKRLEGKLGNDNFVSRAPAAVVDKEKQRLQETLAILDKLNEQLTKMQNLSR